MSDGTLKVLVVEEDERDFLITQGALALAPDARYEVTWARTYEAGRVALRLGEHDVCLLTYEPLARAPRDLLRAVSGQGTAPPIVALYREGGLAVEREATTEGAVEALKKTDLSPLLLSRTIKYALQSKAVGREFLRHTEALEEKNRELSRMQRDLEEKNRELVRLNEEKNGFIGMA